MRSNKLQTQIWLPHSPETMFNFFADPKNLERLTPPWLRFKILTPDPIVMTGGTILDYRLRIRGIPIRWQSEITVWEPPLRFVDRQTKGPYTSWVHEHTFAVHAAGTIVGDRVVYSALGGKLVQKLIIAPDLERIFQFRHKIFRQLFNPDRQKPAATNR